MPQKPIKDKMFVVGIEPKSDFIPYKNSLRKDIKSKKTLIKGLHGKKTNF